MSCPAFASFEELHKELQISFGWDYSHLFEFRVKSPKPVKDLLTIINDVLEDECDFSDLASQDPSLVFAQDIKIEEVLDDQEYQGAVLEYDLRGLWYHKIDVVGHAAASKKFSCIAGEGRGVAEDVDELEGWEQFKEEYRAAVPKKEHWKFKKWYENYASKRDAQGLRGGREWVWHQEGVNKALFRL